MGYDPIEVAQAASQAIEELERSGRVGKTKIVETVILPKTTVTPDQHRTDMGVNGYFPLGGAIPFVAGKTYSVIVDGDRKIYNAQDVDIHCIGNPAIYDNGGFYPDTGELWVLLSYEEMGMSAVGFADPAENEKSHTVAIYEMTKTIHPIDQKFLPGVCLPVVEITSAAYPESGTVELSAEESVKLDAAVAEGFPVVVKMTIFGMPAAVVCTCLGGKMLNGFIVESSIGFAKDDTVWKMGEV